MSLDDILAAWHSESKQYKLIDAWKVLNLTSSHRVAAADVNWAIRCGRAGDQRAQARLAEAYELMIINEMTK